MMIYTVAKVVNYYLPTVPETLELHFCVFPVFVLYTHYKQLKSSSTGSASVLKGDFGSHTLSTGHVMA